MATYEFPWNFFGASMTLMQMIKTGAIPEGQVELAVTRAEKNLEACLLTTPREQDYLDMMVAIQDFRKSHSI